MEPTEVLAMVGGHVDEELLLRNEYVAAEDEILKSRIEGPARLTDPERIRLTKISKRLGRKGLERPILTGPSVWPRRSWLLARLDISGRWALRHRMISCQEVSHKTALTSST